MVEHVGVTINHNKYHLQVLVNQSDSSVLAAQVENMAAFTMTQVRQNHVVVCLVHRDVLTELSCQDMAKEFVMSNDANLQSTVDVNRSYQNICNMSLVSFSLAVIFIIRLFITFAFGVPEIHVHEFYFECIVCFLKNNCSFVFVLCFLTKNSSCANTKFCVLSKEAYTL